MKSILIAVMFGSVIHLANAEAAQRSYCRRALSSSATSSTVQFGDLSKTMGDGTVSLSTRTSTSEVKYKDAIVSTSTLNDYNTALTSCLSTSMSTEIKSWCTTHPKQMWAVTRAWYDEAYTNRWLFLYSNKSYGTCP